MYVWVVSASFFSRVCHRSNPASVTSHRSWSIPVSTQSDSAVFPHEDLFQPSSLQSKLRSIKTRLNWLQTVTDGQKSRRTLDEMSKSHRSRLDTSFCTRWSGSSQLASDKTLSRTACTGAELHCKPTRSVDQLCEMCPSSTLHSSSHCSNDVSVDSVIGFSAGGSEANVTFERQRLHGEGGKGHDCRSRGTEASKEEVTTIVYNTVYNSGAASSATISSGTPVRRDISTPPSPQSSPTTRLWRRFVVGILQKERMSVRRGPVKTLSGRLARKLQRSASLVNAGLSKQIQTVLDAATVDRCDFVEICCSDVPCLTEATQRRGLSSFSLKRCDGVGNHDAQTRENFFWLAYRETTSEGLVITSGRASSEQFDTLLSSIQTDFSTVF